ncbi:hypothetical protein [Staphylococcus xylosus]|uniref:hypothetical protein n=1 Tax=Staphylococcus xylosus TaxID=1288 RepID=UPI003F54C434
MQKSKAIKELFKVQDTKNKFKIIKDYDLQIKGFSNITIDLLEQNEIYISNQIASTQNIKKITNIIKSKIKSEQNLDYLLSIEKIFEKYNQEFNGLLTIFENDKYSELTEKIITSLTIDNSLIKHENSTENEDKETVLRGIIQSLELKLQTKDQKIDEILKLNRELEKKIKNLENQTVKLNSSIKLKTSDLNTKEEILQSKIIELERLNEHLQSKEKHFLHLKNKELNINNTKINIIGAPDLWKLEKSENTHFYNEENVDDFIHSYNNTNNSKFYVVKFGITSYTSRKLKKQIHVVFINNKEEFIKIIRGDLKK